MTEVATNYTTGASSAQNAARTTGKTSGSLGSDQFIQLLMIQLRNQNPLEPMQDKDLMAQITQLNSLQELQKISASIQARDKSSGLTEAVGLIGKTVEFNQEDGTIGSAVVAGVSMISNEIVLWIGDRTIPDRTIPLSSVLSVSAGGVKDE